MPLNRAQLGALLDEAVEERAPSVSFTPEEIDAKAAALRARFARITEAAEARRRLARALEAGLAPERRAGWASSGALAALRVVLSRARRSSRILTEAAREFLPRAPGAWDFVGAEAAAARGATTEASRADAGTDPGGPAVTVIADDTGAERRILATVRRFPAGRPAPVLLVVEGPAGGAAPRVLEVDAEELPEPDPAAAAGLRRLRYEVTLPPGEYDVFLGNPRPAARPDPADQDA
jgi:hypothetical protein